MEIWDVWSTLWSALARIVSVAAVGLEVIDIELSDVAYMSAQVSCVWPDERRDVGSSVRHA